MIIAHLSDLHVSRFGGRTTQLQDLPLRAANGKGWETVRQEGLWSIQSRLAEGKRFQFRDHFRLVDDNGVVHRVIKPPKGGNGHHETLDTLLRLMERRQRTTPEALARHLPQGVELRKLLEADPDNINLRFCAVAEAVLQDRPDQIIITGDLTDDGIGYGLVLAGFADYIGRGRLAAIPGNHDIYPSPPLWVTKSHRKTEPEKRLLWAQFASAIGLPNEGTFLRELDEGVLLVGLDSCHRTPLPASASGLVPMRDLHALAQELDARGRQIRLACLHHHVVNPPIRFTGRAPMEAGMRLRNAKAVFEQLKQLRFHLVMNGHRHVGYRFHPAHAPLFLSAPSTTIGCRSGEKPFYWQIEVGKDRIRSIHEVPIPALG